MVRVLVVRDGGQIFTMMYGRTAASTSDNSFIGLLLIPNKGRSPPKASCLEDLRILVLVGEAKVVGLVQRFEQRPDTRGTE